MKLTSAPLFWKGKARGVNCSWETWLSRWVLTLFYQFKGLSLYKYVLLDWIVVHVSDFSKLFFFFVFHPLSLLPGACAAD